MSRSIEPSASDPSTSDPSTALVRTIQRRRMIRSFAKTPLERGGLDQLLDNARRAPSAGHTQAVEFLVLDTPDDVAAYWNLTLPADRRAGFRWTTLLDAPALVVVLTRPAAYVERYAEPDKARAGLGDTTEKWAVPFWWVDAGAVIENLLLLITDADLGACLFGLFDHESTVLEFFDVPTGYRGVATIAIGHPLADATSPANAGRSALRPRTPIAKLIHRGRW